MTTASATTSTTTHVSPVEEVVIAVEAAEPAPVSPTRLRPFIWGRRAGIVLGSLALSLGATVIARWAAARRHVPTRRRGRRGALMAIQPRVAIIAPSLSISLPFSAMNGTQARTRRRPARNGFAAWRPYALRGRQQRPGWRVWRQVRRGRRGRGSR